VRAALGVDALVGEAQALDGTAADEMLAHDLLGILGLDVAVPDGLGIDDDGGAVLALVEAAGLVDAHAAAEVCGLRGLLQGYMNIASATGCTRGTRRTVWALIGTDKDMMFKDGQLGSILLSPD
jgi:hypothetical protein